MPQTVEEGKADATGTRRRWSQMVRRLPAKQSQVGSIPTSVSLWTWRQDRVHVLVMFLPDAGGFLFLRVVHRLQRCRLPANGEW